MSRRLIVRPEAEEDIDTARLEYEERVRGLSFEFRAELDQTFSSIVRNPELYARIHRDLRRALLRRFPYGVLYVLQPESIVVVAVLHTSRSPKLLRAILIRERSRRQGIR